MLITDELSAAQGAPVTDEPSDHSLLRRFRRGSQDAATQLYLRYAERLAHLVEAECSADLVRNLDVEDIVQSIFGTFFQGARRGYYDVPHGDDLWKLFLVIALNKIRAKGAFHHAAKRDVRRTKATAHIDQSVKPSGNLYQQAFLEVVLLDTLERLPPLHREMVEFRMEGYEVAEIAGRVGRAKRTVERILQEARKKLETLMREEN